MEKKGFGLQLRIVSAKQQPPPPRPHPPAIFVLEDDGDNVESDISRQASKMRSIRKVQEQHEKALKEDRFVFDYDGQFDAMKQNAACLRTQDKALRESKYVVSLKKQAQERKRQHEIIYQKKILKDRNKDELLFPDKEKFVTSSYKKVLAEFEKWNEEDKLCQIREDKEDVTKKRDLSQFYFGLSENIAFGAKLEKPTKPLKQERAFDDIQKPLSESLTREVTMYSTGVGGIVDAQSEILQPLKNQTSNEISQKKHPVEPALPTQNSEPYKRNENVLSAARERYMTRKRARYQL